MKSSFIDLSSNVKPYIMITPKRKEIYEKATH